ncbi:hydroperoxide isomerase ALOXE3-like [Clinocottus analis]|uniref:hydroperoxide isomerase ALOXE3-like n=1 Tax=Clinocottus analis TaxID=304258 RepID=UPI0035C0FDBA
MAEYKLEVTTGDMKYAGTWDHIYVTLFGTEGQSERTELDNFGRDHVTGTTGTYTLSTNLSLGKLLLLKVEKDPFAILPEDEWYLSKIVVTTPEGEALLFPCYRWISRGELVELRGGRALKGFEEDHPLLIDHREKELILRKSFYHGLELKIKGLLGSAEKWESIEDMKKIFWWRKTTMSEYVTEHWKDDDFYGFQFLNGLNPMVIKRCSALPPNFAVTEEMVKPFLKDGSSLQEEMKTSLGFDGLTEFMRRHLSETTYSSLCLPENITARGLESIPNFYYRDDGLKLWNIINSFVKAVVEYYYPSDSEVCKDTELQNWISEIFTHGFLGNKASGFSAGFHTVQEVIKFITMVIFTVTGQHSAVNNGQFDYFSWPPNGPLLLRKPPPTTKGQSSMETILETLPNVGEAINFVVLVCLLSENYSDMVPIGAYPNERFHEPAIKQMMKEFQAELSYLSETIATRNLQLEIPYSYLDPPLIENSIAI